MPWAAPNGATASGNGAGPRRTCVGCRRIAPPAALIRLAVAPDGRVAVGPGPGRGAWLCAGSQACFEAAVRRQALSRGLRRRIGADEVDRLRATLYGRRTAEGRPR
ncbi:MAG: YlxR family protein [Actinobacteria bacterium]|nr:YlxR family protein [Actinomycetota bacterium]